MGIATLIAADRLSRGDISTARDVLAACGCEAQPERWLDIGVAADIPFEGPLTGTAEAIEHALPQVDVAIQAEQTRAKRLLVADMDSTMISVECIDELADYAGLKAEVAAITEQAMAGALDFEGALRARVRLLRGLRSEIIDRCREDRVRLTPGARTLVQTMQKNGARCVLVSGGFTRFAEPVAAAIGFHRVVANVLEVEKGRLSGAVLPPIVDAEAKSATLADEARALGLGPPHILAIGDGANDIPMLEAAGLGIAYHAKPAAQAAADVRIRNGDLSAVLYVLGYPREAWIC